MLFEEKCRVREKLKRKTTQTSHRLEIFVHALGFRVPFMTIKRLLLQHVALASFSSYNRLYERGETEQEDDTTVCRVVVVGMNSPSS